MSHFKREKTRLPGLRRAEPTLAWLWLALVAVLAAGWIFYCVTPDQQRGLIFLRRQLRSNVIEQYRLGAKALEENRNEDAVVHLGAVADRTRGRSYRNLLGRLRARTMIDLGEAFRRMGSSGKAVSVLAEAALVDPGNYRVHLARGRILAALGEEGAEEALLQAFRLNPSSLDVTEELVALYTAEERYEAAWESYREYVAAFMPAFGVLRAGDAVAEICFPVDGEEHRIEIPFEQPVSGRADLEVELNHEDLSYLHVSVFSPDSTGGEKGVELAETGFTGPELRYPQVSESLSIDEEVFQVPRYVFRATLSPGEGAMADHAVLSVVGMRPLSERLYRELDVSLAGLDRDSDRRLLKEEYETYQSSRFK
ncbi:MAG: hypothetical protein KJ626_06895 [Verrucomicrobia bacterium]|nr:hypothetical protein [Verrucomicrobiota bacterium]